jgi:hypothetical protein
MPIGYIWQTCSYDVPVFVCLAQCMVVLILNVLHGVSDAIGMQMRKSLLLQMRAPDGPDGSRAGRRSRAVPMPPQRLSSPRPPPPARSSSEKPKPQLELRRPTSIRRIQRWKGMHPTCTRSLTDLWPLRRRSWTLKLFRSSMPCCGLAGLASR